MPHAHISIGPSGRFLLLPKLSMKYALALSVSLFCLLSSAQAGLLSVRDWEGAPSGNGYITFDSRTNLEWLDVNLSTTLTFDDQLALVAPGGTYEGFRVATTPELDSLFITAFGKTDHFAMAGDTTFRTEVVSLIDMLGRTDVGRLGFATDFQYVAGRLAEQDLSFPTATQNAGYIRNEDSAFFNHAYFNSGNFANLPRNVADLDIGAFFVRTAVPEPTPLFSLAIVLVIAQMCRRIRQEIA